MAQRSKKPPPTDALTDVAEPAEAAAAAVLKEEEEEEPRAASSELVRIQPLAHLVLSVSVLCFGGILVCPRLFSHARAHANSLSHQQQEPAVEAAPEAEVDPHAPVITDGVELGAPHTWPYIAGRNADADQTLSAKFRERPDAAFPPDPRWDTYQLQEHEWEAKLPVRPTSTFSLAAHFLIQI